MGCYINPQDMSKEEWLSTNGIRLTEAPLFNDNSSMLPVCLVDNGAFTAAAIAYSEHVLEVFGDPRDIRPKKWYLVEKTKLTESGFLK